MVKCLLFCLSFVYFIVYSLSTCPWCVLQAQKALKDEERLAYLDVDKSNEERQKGNDLFQKGCYKGMCMIVFCNCS